MLSAETSRHWSVTGIARDNGHVLSAVASPVATSAAAGAIVIDPVQRFQEMTGFGGALTESSACALAVLKESNAPVNFVLTPGGESLACTVPAHAIQTYACGAQ